MPIRILPARLANQIAAGEVVERPASVVKELVENSLDSGATRIDVDIEKGGSKLIRVRDNGQGIDKDELMLALSRHATSKVHTLDDLEAIMSLGFRGEALASISSVSRLTLTSRPATQEQAWAAQSEGREMEVKLQPTAHPIGTSVEVVDLFFNTPARRKFLRTEKTEFTHIDELLKRIALSCFDVTINLRHNGAMVRQYRAAKTDIQKEKRLAAVCGSAFVRNMIKVELEHQGLALSGWITTPEGARQQSDLQYCYVNGRMMRDKLINHAIRQSYESSLKPEQFATYVLYIELDPHQVDVNVHPAKHEVRFHQARLVHDFIYQALTSALAEVNQIERREHSASAFSHNDERVGVDEISSHECDVQAAEDDRVIREVPRHVNQWPAPTHANNPYHQPVAPSVQEQRNYQRLMAVDRASIIDDVEGGGTDYGDANRYHGNSGNPNNNDASRNNATQTVTEAIPELKSLGKAIKVVEQRYLLTYSAEGVVLVSLSKVSWLKTRAQLNGVLSPLKSQPLLVPLSIKLDKNEQDIVKRLAGVFGRLGIIMSPRSGSQWLVMSVPHPLRHQNLQTLIPDLIEYAVTFRDDNEQSVNSMIDWLSDRVCVVKNDYTLSEAIQMIAELEQLLQGQLPLNDVNLVNPVDFSATIAAMNL
jgi:DNA mismatch repair protein MutL